MNGASENRIELSTQELLSKLIFLEERLGATVGYQTIGPFSIDANDAIDLNFAASRIGQFLGLSRILFVVCARGQKKNVAGQIDVQSGRDECFIEIARDLSQMPLVAVHVLCHEITHKYLDLHHVSVGNGPFHQFENEVLTDVAAVFLGMGRVMLNGCQGCWDERSNNGTKGSRQTARVGYISDSTFAKAYAVVSATRGISRFDASNGLTMAASSVLQTAWLRLDSELQLALMSGDTSAPDLESELDHDRRTLAEIEYSIDFLRRKMIDPCEGELVAAHKVLAECHRIASLEANSSVFDPVLKALHRFRQALVFWEHRRALQGSIQQAQELAAKHVEQIRLLSPFEEHPRPLEVSRCRVCGTSVGTEGFCVRNQTIVCPNRECGHRFIMPQPPAMTPKPFRPSGTIARDPRSFFAKFRRAWAELKK